MKKNALLALLALVFCVGCYGQGGSPTVDCKNDVKDHRGKMKPWEKGARETGQYRNVFLEAGYSRADIDAKLAKAYYDVFEGPGRIYFEVGDSMAYVSDLKNHDARTEGLSYGMMVAVQLNKKDVFDRLWRWTKKYMQHQGGARDAYFAWSVEPKTGKHNSEGSASDGEFYFVTDLLFASNRWGNSAGINYYAEARRILDAMWSKDGTEGIKNVINTEHKQISFVPDPYGYNWTDPSYHLPAFFEIWAEYAKDGKEQFYRDCADTARAFLHRACHPVTGLNNDYTEFSGAPRTQGHMGSAFRYDSWRVPMNIAMDYSWFAKDQKWQQDYGNRIQNFLFCRGIDTFEDQFNTDGTLPASILQAGGYQKLRHSIGLVSTSAAASLMGTQYKSWKFVDALWNARLEPYSDGYFDPYYDGLLYLFSIMHLSGNYRIITPEMNKNHYPNKQKNNEIATWENLRFGAFVHFNDNTFLQKEISQNTDPKIFNPVEIRFDSMMITLQKAGVKYAVLTTRHTSGFCLWDSKVTEFDVAESAYPHDVVKLFVDACRRYQIKPCLYYCLWGNKDWNPANWNPIIKEELKSHSPKEIILAQLTELAENYGDIYEFWMDMQCWADTSITTQEIYNLLKSKAPKALVHFNQQVQEGTKIKYFPTDILNGEERIPPAAGHKVWREVGNATYYLPFEYEITSQRCDTRTLGNGLMKGSVWFSYLDSHFYPVDSLYKYIKLNFERGGSNVLLSTAPDATGCYRKADQDSIIRLGNLIRLRK